MTISTTSKPSVTPAIAKSTATSSGLADQPVLKKRRPARTSFGKTGKRPDLPVSVRSKWEANLYRLLIHLKEIGDIEDFAYEGQRYDFPVRSKNNFYIPDFRIKWADGRTTCFEVKGYMDKDSRAKLRYMLRFYPSITVDVLGREAYLHLADEWSHVIPNWE